MNSNWLKNAYEKIPKNMKFAFAPLFIKKMVDNPVFRNTWDEIDFFEEADADKKEEFQLKKLKNTLIYSYNNVPFYKARFDEAGFNPYAVKNLSDIEKIPLLEKAEAVEAGKTLYSRDSSLNYYETYTGGSSGQSLKVLLDTDSIYAERAFICHFLSRFGYNPRKTRAVALCGQNKDIDYYFSPLKNEIMISPFHLFKDENIKGICRDIKKFNAEFLLGYPSAISQLARCVKKQGIDLSFNHIVFYAENYSLADKRLAESVFSCKADSYYGHTERAVFAEITDDVCVFNGAYGYTELIPTNVSNEYRVVCSGFLSKKMPLIRYATDDYVVIDDAGRKHLIGHKRSDVHLVAKNGAQIFKGALTLHVPELKSIKRYQYYQREPGKAELCIMTDAPLSSSEERHLCAYIDRRTEGLLDVELKYVDQIELTPRGKERWAVVDIPTR